MSSSYYDHNRNNREYHFLGACFMCNKQLGLDHDIFMYRGNTPFCSEECRRKQIMMDDHSKRKKSLNTSKRTEEDPPQDLHLHNK